ncbi:MAG: cupin domain-containing protein [Candidatus Dojkabacteria bacterium]
MSYQINILEKTKLNEFFREVLFTGAKSQLVVMCIEPGGDIGEETHPHVEQILFNLSGIGKVILDGVESEFKPGDVVVVTPGTKHNFINTGTEKLKIYTIYTPANHIDGTIHKTKADAVADVKDEEFGNKVA